MTGCGIIFYYLSFLAGPSHNIKHKRILLRGVFMHHRPKPSNNFPMLLMLMMMMDGGGMGGDNTMMMLLLMMMMQPGGLVGMEA